MRIGIELNGVVRDLIDKIEEVYVSTYLSGEDEDEHKQFELIDGEELIEIAKDPIKYKIKKPFNSFNLRDHFEFKDDNELYEFLYEDHPMKIFGGAPTVDADSAHELNSAYFEMRNEHELIILSDEIALSKPATLFFLSKHAVQLERVIFYNLQTMPTIWKEIDVLVTANPEMINKAPDGIEVVKFNRLYNITLDSKMEINSLRELPAIIKNITNV